MKRNEVILVDINDNSIGIKEKYSAHKKPLLHRAFSIFLYNDNNEILIQKRQANKYHSGGLWSNACCSHPRIGETLEESTKDRLMDEIGVVTPVEEIFSFVYMSKYAEDLYEYEYDHVFLGKYNGKINLNMEEASEVKWIGLEELSNELVYEPQKYATWFIISAPRVIEEIKKRLK